MLVGSLSLALAFQLHSVGWLLVGGTCIAGIGMTLCFTGYSVIAMDRVPTAHLGVGSSLINTAYFLGGGMGLPLISAFMNSAVPMLLLGALALGSIIVVQKRP